MKDKKIRLGLVFVQFLFLIVLNSNFVRSLKHKEDTFRNVIFKPEIKERALIGHVISTGTVQNIDECRALCYLEPNCVSINYKLKLGKRRQGECELNSLNEENHSEELKREKGAVYQAMVNNCNAGACAAEYQICQSGYGSDGYRCVLHKNAKNTILSFRNQSSENVVILENPFSKNLTTFTACMWFQLDQAVKTVTLLTYATKSGSMKYEAIYVMVDEKKVDYGVAKTKKKTGDIILDNKWYHLCLTWQSQNSMNNGLMQLYINGKKNLSDSVTSNELITNGALVLGQEQDSYKGTFDQHQSFKGNLTSVNIWDKVLSDTEILNLAKSCPSGEGNVVKWTDLIQLGSKTIKIISGISCRP